MKNISPLKNIHKLGRYGNFENKDDDIIIKIKEIKDIFIYQVVKFKNSQISNNLKIDDLMFPEHLKVNANNNTRILWMGPNNWLIISVNSLNDYLKKNFLADDFAITDISHSRSIIELEGKNIKEVVKKGSPLNIDELKKNDCANTVFNGITITIDNIETNPKKLRIISLRSFGESLYHSVTDSCLEFGYKSH